MTPLEVLARAISPFLPDEAFKARLRSIATEGKDND